MTFDSIKAAFNLAIKQTVDNISLYTVNPKKHLIRNRKIAPDKLLSFLVSCGSSSTKLELLDFFNLDPNAPSASAFSQQRAKLKPDALEAVFRHFNSSLLDMEKKSPYRFLAADGSTFTFFSKPSFAPSEYFVSEGHSAKGFYSMHLNALYDLQKHTYSDALIQPVHQKDEFRAFCDMIDRHDLIAGVKDVFIGDRGYCSYNNMAHVIEKKTVFSIPNKRHFFQRPG